MGSSADTPPLVDPTDTTVGNRFAPYGPENHSAPLWIVSILGLIYSVGVLMVRMYIKRRVFGWDDVLIAVGTVFGLIQAIVLFRALHSGLGQVPENIAKLSTTASLTFSSQILLLITQYIAKCSGILLLRRLFVRDNQKFSHHLCDISLGITVVCGIATVVLGSAGCSSPGSFNQHCSIQNARWITITSLDIATEIILLFLPAYLVQQLQMKFRYKLRVIVAFCFRILVIVFSIIHLSARIKYTDNPKPSPFNIVYTLVWHQTLLAWSLISTTIPNLKAFLQSLSANWGGADWGYTSKAYGNGTFEMKNMNTSSRPGVGTQTSTIGTKKKFDTQVTAHQIGERGSIGSGGSQDMIIRKETVWTVVRS